jgi:tetratricopeptide (TPR) repeat protein
MRTTLLLILLLATLVEKMEAQGHPAVKRATSECQSKMFDQALLSIDEALTDEEEKNNPYAWYVKGFIYKEIYKDQESKQKESTARSKAIECFKHSMGLDSEKKYLSMNQSAMRFLATSFYNDALKRTKEMTKETESEPELLYQQFKENMSLVDPSFSFKTFDAEIYKSLAQGHYSIWQNNTQDPHHANQCNTYYTKLLSVDPTNCEASYNLSILHYNQGVYKIRSIDSNMDIIELIMIQDECVQLFKEALPHAENTFKNCPPKIDYYKALMFTYRALGKEDMYTKYLNESEELIRSGALNR